MVKRYSTCAFIGRTFGQLECCRRSDNPKMCAYFLYANTLCVPLSVYLFVHDLFVRSFVRLFVCLFVIWFGKKRCPKNFTRLFSRLDWFAIITLVVCSEQLVAANKGATPRRAVNKGAAPTGLWTLRLSTPLRSNEIANMKASLENTSN